MKKIISILGLSLALLVGTASAFSPVQIDDSGFNYEAAEDAYTSLSYENGQLTVLVTDEVSIPALKVTGADALPVDDVDDYSAGQLQAFIPVSEELTGVSVEHSDTRLNLIVDSYSNLFEAEGFSGSLEQAYANGQVMVYENQGTTARVIFTQLGENVMVYVTTL